MAAPVRIAIIWALCANLAAFAASPENVRPLEEGEEVPSAPAAEAVPASDPKPEAKTVITRQTLFSIPFQIDASDGAEPEARLYVSEDSGRTWRQAGAADAKQRSFAFRAPGDGRYLFSLRLADQQGRLTPPGDHVAGLAVVVDTAAPKLDFSATRGDSGEVVAIWQASDANLNASAFRIQYQEGPGEPWRDVALDRTRDAPRGVYGGRVTWWPRTNSGLMSIRADVADAAGNPTVTHVQLRLDTPATENIASPSGKNDPDKSPPPRKTARVPGGREYWPPDVTHGSLSKSIAATERPASPPRKAGPSPLAPTREQPVLPAAARSTSTQPDPPTGNDNLLPPGERPKWVGAKRFQLQYEIESVGPSGVGKVELWSTRDGGRTWQSLGIDSDNKSPFAVAVDEAGVHGFRISVESRSGLGGSPPREGDLPEIWIGVDLVRPKAEITQVSTSFNGPNRQLVIQWSADDEHLVDRPVTLLFADKPGGPWATVAAGLANTGEHRWNLDRRLPDQVYLRLEVRDEAGHLGVFETAAPVPLDGTIPKGKIRGVESAPETSARPTPAAVR